ncbi:coiled-coil domain-containing protein 86 [Brachionichthys hirsutus]|uniref:coiled-coil domain-containing protein 86 n=1 Tax=Brachionichthys hirsutus TaxID=412623 RepID=UPI00360505EA
MSKRQRSASQVRPEAGHGEEEVPEPAPEPRRTRSGRQVRPPAALRDSGAPVRTPVRTPVRRTRRSVLQEIPAVEEENQEVAEILSGEKPDRSAEPEPCGVTESAGAQGVHGDGGVDIGSTAEVEVTAPSGAETVPKKPRPEPSVKQNPGIPLGKPKSGRVWKNRNKQRFSALVRDKPLCSSWEKKMASKREKELVKRFSLQLKEGKAKQREEKRNRREENLKRRAENERRSEIVQVIRNTAKIKRMKKKQLRKVEKRDTLALLQKSQKQNAKVKGHKSKVPQEMTVNAVG